MLTPRTSSLTVAVERLLKDKSSELLFHGWHHAYFVAKKAVEFASEFTDANKEIIEAAGLTHDLNFAVAVNSEPEAGKELREQYLRESGFNPDEINQVEQIVMAEHMATRSANISNEAKAVSDADTLFKALPVVPVLFAGHYLLENHVDIKKLADKVVGEQRPLMDQNIYFYTKLARDKYLHWAQTNLALWENVQAALEDEVIKEMLEIAKSSRVI